MAMEIIKDRLTVDEFIRLDAEGYWGADARLELLDGEVFELVSENPPHSYVVTQVGTKLVRALPDRAIVRINHPLVKQPSSHPVPDVAVCLAAPADYAVRHPEPEEVALAVEVGMTSIRADLRVKARLYAVLGIPEYWVIAITRDLLLRHTRPGPDGYALVETLGRSQTVTPLAFPDVSFEVASFLPPRQDFDD